MVKGDWEDETAVDMTPGPVPAVKHPDRAYLLVLVGGSVGEMFQLEGDRSTIGRGAQAAVRLADDGISRAHAEITVEDDHMVIDDLGSTNGTFVNNQRVAGKRVLRDGDKIQVGSTTILKFSFHDALAESFQREMYDAALRDSLTRAYNKRYFSERLDAEFAFARRHLTALSLILFDVDHFKKVNDNHGHLIGDAVLSAIGRTVGAMLRAEDLFARVGGEEFAVICRGIDLGNAVRAAERLRNKLGELAVPLDDGQLSITVSAGVAAVKNDTLTAAHLQREADEALYSAKRDGRNRVIAAR